MELEAILRQVRAGDLSVEEVARLIGRAYAGSSGSVSESERGHGGTGQPVGGHAVPGRLVPHPNEPRTADIRSGGRPSTAGSGPADAIGGLDSSLPSGTGTPAPSVADLGFAQLDLERERRTGFPEVVFGQGKTAEQLVAILRTLREHSDRVLATRVDADKAERVLAEAPGLTYHPTARALTWFRRPSPPELEGYVAVLCAGTSDLPVAEEAAVTIECAGSRVERIYDVGVAGIHRLFRRLDTIRGANVVVVVAGMEGALASVVGGLVAVPVIAVPTSVGYGANFQGMAALLSMLNACAPGITVVNIDNGFGAGYAAALINRNLSGQRTRKE